MTKTKTKMNTNNKLNAKTTVARIPVVDIVVNFIPVGRIESQRQMQTQMRSQIMINLS